MQKETIQEKLEKLRKMGLTVTMQRAMVLDRLVKANQHLTAEQIYEGLNDKYPHLSKATVYNSLEVFKEAGIIQELIVNKGKAHYDPDPTPHLHFHCLKCGKIYDLSSSLPIYDQEEIEGHKVEAVKACLYGICKKCLNS